LPARSVLEVEARAILSMRDRLGATFVEALDLIRACQGHSLANMPVTLEALEASWDVVHPAGLLWHGTTLQALRGIARYGIRPGARSHVHLAGAVDSRIGKRARVEVLLAVTPVALRASGLTVFQAPNGVLLVREVPVACIAGARPGVTTPADTVAAACRAAGLPAGDPLARAGDPDLAGSP
jgi:putative RNA 2'-phosphotransferase